MRVLIVKLSSMGDVIQTLPALTDAAKHISGIRFDWVVDETFAEIPRWHASVDRVWVSAHRRWRRQRTAWARDGEFRQFAGQLRAQQYDAVVDAQGNLKSAVVTALSRGRRHGFDRHSVREWGAHLVCGTRHHVPRDQHAILRTRRLFADALGYPFSELAPDFSIDLGEQAPLPAIDRSRPYLVFVQNATWTNKRWREDHWRQLIALAGKAGYGVYLPWGSTLEKVQVEALAIGQSHVTVLPRLSLGHQALVLSGSAGAVCVDTGLAHLAAALNVPTVTLYGATDPALVGAQGERSAHLLAEGYACAPCYKRYCSFEENTDHRDSNNASNNTDNNVKNSDAACMKNLRSDSVWATLQALMAKQKANLIN